jgi:hypothetical protein
LQLGGHVLLLVEVDERDQVLVVEETLLLPRGLALLLLVILRVFPSFGRSPFLDRLQQDKDLPPLLACPIDAPLQARMQNLLGDYLRRDQADRGLQRYDARDAQFVFDRQFEEFGRLANFIFVIAVNFVIVSLSIAAHRNALFALFEPRLRDVGSTVRASREPNQDNDTIPTNTNDDEGIKEPSCGQMKNPRPNGLQSETVKNVKE